MSRDQHSLSRAHTGEIPRGTLGLRSFIKMTEGFLIEHRERETVFSPGSKRRGRWAKGSETLSQKQTKKPKKG
jgi:hypothetical protein